MSEHLHLNAASALAVFLMVVVTVGTANLLSKKYAGHPAADAWAELMGSGC
jgi:hypothetical protein